MPPANTDDGPECGIPPQQQCATSTDCPSGEVCHAIYDNCSPTGTGSLCGPKCGACNTGFRCNAMGACEPLPCNQGYICASYQRCDPPPSPPTGPVYDQTQGCVSITCAADANCPAGLFCVNSICQTAPGTCKQEIAVP